MSEIEKLIREMAEKRINQEDKSWTGEAGLDAVCLVIRNRLARMAVSLMTDEEVSRVAEEGHWLADNPEDKD